MIIFLISDLTQVVQMAATTDPFPRPAAAWRPIHPPRRQPWWPLAVTSRTTAPWWWWNNPPRKHILLVHIINRQVKKNAHFPCKSKKLAPNTDFFSKSWKLPKINYLTHSPILFPFGLMIRLLNHFVIIFTYCLKNRNILIII